MNAQEAIEKAEKMLKKIQTKKLWFKEGYLTVTEYRHLIEEEKAFSILLESARLFHEHTVPDLKRANLNFGRSEEYKTIYGVPLEKVGIELDKEEGADEPIKTYLLNSFFDGREELLKAVFLNAYEVEEEDE